MRRTKDGGYLLPPDGLKVWLEDRGEQSELMSRGLNGEAWYAVRFAVPYQYALAFLRGDVELSPAHAAAFVAAAARIRDLESGTASATPANP